MERTAFDNPWKTIIETYFEDFMGFFFCDIAEAIDWTIPHAFLDKELEKVMRDADSGNRYVDKLAKVQLKTGQETVLYIHIEVQSQYDADFSRRMFIYHYRLFDRYQLPVVSLAVLGDDDSKWKPDQYQYENFGCSLCFKFPSIKLLDYKQENLHQNKNPFAIITRTHLSALETRQKPQQRLEVKLTLTKALYQAGYDKQDILNLFHFIDWMLNLPKSVEQQFALELDEYEEQQKMRYVTSIERNGIEKGLEQGLEKGIVKGIEQGLEQGIEKGEVNTSRQYILDVLTLRFQKIPKSIENTIQQINDFPVLSLLHKEAIVTTSIELFERVLTENCDKLSLH